MRISILWLFLYLSSNIHAQSFSIGEFRSEDSTASPPFSIVRVEPFSDLLRLFLETDQPETVAEILSSSGLEAQLSDNELETTTSAFLALGKAAYCTIAGQPVYLSYSAPLPDCSGRPPVKVEYFIETTVTLGPGRDLAIVLDPDFMWLIEEA